MASLLDSLSESLTPDSIGKVGQMVGLDASKATQGLGVVGPLLLGSLAQKSGTTTGLDSIMRMLPQESGGIAGLLGGLFGSGSKNPLASASDLTSVLGPGVSTIGKALSGRLGFNVGPLIAMATPAVLSLLSKTAKDNKLNSADIAALLTKEHSATMAAATPEVKAVLDEAFKLADRASQLQARFLDDEWRRIRLSPLAVTMYVVSASPSGMSGLSKEIVAAGGALEEVVKDALPTSLVDVAFGSFPAMQELEGASALDPDAPRASLLTAIREAAAAVKAKSPADATSFGQTLSALSRKVAEASKEGGFLGVGGTKVSPQEEQAIAEITVAVQ